MFLYRFVRRCQTQTFVHAITFEWLFRFLLFWAQLLALTYRLPDEIWSIFVVTLTFNFEGIFQIWNLLYLSQKWSDCHKWKANILIECKASNVTIRFDLGHDLDLDFSRSNVEFAISQPKMVRLPRNKKQTYRMNSRPQMWPMGLTLAVTFIFEFSRSNVA